MFYCLSRYYDPEIGRFISPDSLDYLEPDTINGLNLYCYCGNNPVMYIDSDGHFPILAMVIGGLIAFGCTMYTDYANDGQFFNGDVTGWQYLGSVTTGVLAGAFGQAGNVLVRLAGILGSEIVGSLISENVNYNMDTLKKDIIIGLTSFGIAEGLNIVGKRITRAIYNKMASNTTKEAAKQLRNFASTGKTPKVWKPNAQRILNITSKINKGFTFLKDSTGNFYSIVTGISGSTIIDW